MRFHVVSLPHTQVTRAYNVCAYTTKVRGFVKMMKDLGHAVFLYAGDQTDAPCDELIPCISEDERAAVVGDGSYVNASFDWALPHWQKFNANVIAGIKQRAAPHDFICVIAGVAQQPIADALPHMMTVEFGVGYGGTFSKYRVFESYAWMHTCYGSKCTNPHDLNGAWYDAVIPGYLDPADFPFSVKKGNYCLFVGRLIERKGVHIAAHICRTLGKKLVIAGPGDSPITSCYSGIDYRGVVGPEERGKLMAGACCLLAPTLYIEPFGNVAIEAMACGTPVIATDWGAFTETIIDGTTGYRCRTLKEFCEAVECATILDPHRIRQHVVRNYSLPKIGQRYDEYFARLSDLWRGGWYELA